MTFLSRGDIEGKSKVQDGGLPCQIHQQKVVEIFVKRKIDVMVRNEAEVI